MRDVPRLQRKSFSAPDQVRKFSMGHVDIVNLDETAVGRFKWEPGWRWSEVVKPVVDTPSCVNRHLGYVIGGHLHVVMDDGTELDIVAGDVYEIPAGSRRVDRGRRGVRRRRIRERAGCSGSPPTRRTSGRWRPSCSPTSSIRRRRSRGWVTKRGDVSCSITTTRSAASSTGSAAARSSRPATGSWPCSTARRGPSAVRPR